MSATIGSDDFAYGVQPDAAWTSMFPKVPKPDRIRGLQKFVKV
ncbi:MAG TPA: hypothetical protein VL614_26325 [Acetobacteraceae bacterium]|jgi:hypothetical protein|nr:hypothetical protein [Acetobacteraceae bacterium]